MESPDGERVDDYSPMDYVTQSPMMDDPLTLSALMSHENYPDFYSPFYSPAQQISTNWASLASPNSLPGVSDRSMKSVVPKPVPGSISLAERMLGALSLFKESSCGGILAQVWMPIKNRSGYVLSTTDQPFLLDQTLAGYREVSRTFTFSAEAASGMFPGLPGRVFISGLPEWTSNVGYYNKFEYLRADFAQSHEVRGSLAVPIFDNKEPSCCAVLELVTMTEKPDFDEEIDSVCNALQAVDLRTIKGKAYQRSLTKNQKFALAEILDVLRACCHAHMLPLALTWAPFSSDESNLSLRKKSLLCIQDSACYVNDTRINGFLHACAEHFLEKGQGIAGKALQSNHPFFSPDVKNYDIREYPLAHHARKYGLSAAVAIRLRSTFTGNDDYILEFFLPFNCRGSSEQQELLNNLSTTMQRICKSLRTVSEAEVVASDSTKAEITSSSPDISINHSQGIDSDREVSIDLPAGEKNSRSDEQGDAYYEQINSDSRRQTEKKRYTAEKNISLNELRQYFSGSLKDAAKSIGVCPTTLKRICRQHGISRWPSRKINKVNRSLKKIQNVINSVQGVEGALKYDPISGCLVASVSSSEKSTMATLEKAEIIPSSSTPEISKVETVDLANARKCETTGACNNQANVDGASFWPADSINACSKGGLSLENSDSMEKSNETNAKIDTDDIKERSHPSSSGMTDSSSGSASSFPTFRESLKDKASTVTVKATYKDDNVRFKFVPSMGCERLFEEIGERYKLAMGTFQLKYMDDEKEWVILASDGDLQECVEVLESVGSKNLKLLVRDMQCSIGSSCGSNFSQA